MQIYPEEEILFCEEMQKGWKEKMWEMDSCSNKKMQKMEEGLQMYQIQEMFQENSSLLDMSNHWQKKMRMEKSGSFWQEEVFEEEVCEKDLHQETLYQKVQKALQEKSEMLESEEMLWFQEMQEM